MRSKGRVGSESMILGFVDEIGSKGRVGSEPMILGFVDDSLKSFLANLWKFQKLPTQPNWTGVGSESSPESVMLGFFLEIIIIVCLG